MNLVEIVLWPQSVANDEHIKEALHRKLQLNDTDKISYRIVRKSLDARSRQPKYVLQIAYAINEILQPEVPYERAWKNVGIAEPVAIIGAGPAGLFAAMQLIELGLKPVIIEQGKTVRDRRRDLAILTRDRIVNPYSNYCFGEGGAGTYSDGKLYTRSTKRGDVMRILQTLVLKGAPQHILTEAHPHIGTNKLPGIIENIREQIIECGGEILFSTQFTGLILQNNAVRGIALQSAITGHSVTMPVYGVVLATGHSARSVYQYFHDHKLAIELKPFALGVRIEHPQSLIDKLQYHGEFRDEALPPASYSVAYTNAQQRGCYSFCMCPGGIIAPAATAAGEVVVNGWSPSRRNNAYANSGMVVNIMDHDLVPYKHYGALAALQFQKDIEKKCFDAGGKNLMAPAQRVADFMTKRTSDQLPPCSYFPGIVSTAMEDVLPATVVKSLREGLSHFGKRMQGYITNEAVMVATESRTSAPVRIPRDKISLMHTSVSGLFPCAEGSGYAGGIVSAAIDGERCATAVHSYLSLLKK